MRWCPDFEFRGTQGQLSLAAGDVVNVQMMAGHWWRVSYRCPRTRTALYTSRSARPTRLPVTQQISLIRMRSRVVSASPARVPVAHTAVGIDSLTRKRGGCRGCSPDGERQLAGAELLRHCLSSHFTAFHRLSPWCC